MTNSHAPLGIERAPDILVTGATGLVGRWLLAALTRNGHTVAALVRQAERRAEELAAFVARLGGDPRRLVVIEGDVERAGLGLATPLPEVRVVYHLAARFAFGLTRPQAHATNVIGTEHALRWAAGQPSLERFVFLGGYRMTARPLAELDEAALEKHYAAGAYEGSKLEAYALFRRLVEELKLPWTAVHPSGVIGDSRTGETTQLAGLGETVQQLFAGRLPALAGSARTFVPVVTVDYLAELLASVPARAQSRGRELVVFDPASPPLPELVARIASVLGVPAPARLLPVRLVAALPTAWTGLSREALQFLVEDRYDTEEAAAQARAAGLSHPNLDDALARWGAYLVSTRFLTAPPATRSRYLRGTFSEGDPQTAEVVLVHGIPFDGEAMAPLASALGLSAAAVDLPGLGRSGRGAIGPSWLGRLLAGRERPVVLVGHSLGASVVAQYAAEHEGVAAVVLLAPSFLMAPASWSLRLRPVVARVLAGLDARAFARRFLAEDPEAAGSLATASAVAALARQGAGARYAAALSDAISGRHRAYARAAYARLRERGVPTLIVHDASEPLTQEPRGAQVLTLSGTGHSPHLTRTAEVARAVREFLEEEGALRAA